MLKLAACSSLHWPVAESPRDLRALLKEETGQSIRRINRFIELALLGAQRCARVAAGVIEKDLGSPALAHGAAPGGIPPDTALYLCFDVGMLADTTRIMAGYAQGKRAPTPFEFMNTSGGMAGFHVAQMLKLDGPQLSLHRNHVSLEAALQLLQLQSAPHRRALVGYVEEGCWPAADQRERFHWDGEFIECSHWLYFDGGVAAPLATIESCTRYADFEALAAAVATLDKSQLWFAATERSRSPEQDWSPALGLPQRFEAPELAETSRCFSSGLPALALSAFARSELKGRLLHVNRSGSGEYLATLMRKSV